MPASGLFRCLRVVLIVVQMGMCPAVDATVAFVPDFRIRAWLALEIDLPRLRHIDLELLVEHDAAVFEVITDPELSRRKRVDDVAHKLILEYIVRPHRRYADVLLVVVGIHQCIGIGDILDRRFLRGDHRAIWLDHADIRDLELVAERAVSHLKLA